MASLPAEEPRVFDLAPEAARLVKQRRWGLLFVAGVLVGLLVLALAAALTPSTPKSPAWLHWLAAAVVGTLALVGLAFTMTVKSTTPLDRLTLRESGLDLHFGDGVEDACSWRDTNLAITMYDHHEDPWRRRQPVEVLFPGGRSGALPFDVAEAVYDAAQKSGAPVLVQRETLIRGKSVQNVVAIRIGRPEGTPDWKANGN